MQFTRLEKMGKIPGAALADIRDFLFPEDPFDADEVNPDDPERNQRTMSLSSTGSSEGEEGVQEWDDWGPPSAGVIPAGASSSSMNQNKSENESTDAGGSVPWLHLCLISSIPSTEIAILAYEQKCVVLEAKLRTYASNSDLQRQSGEIQFYTSQGSYLFMRQFSKSDVKSINLNTVLHDSQELSVLYGDCLVTIDGLGLFASLKGCRSQVARGDSSGENLDEYLDLSFKKWQLEEGKGNREHVCGGPLRLSRFDQLEAASTMGGPGSRVSASAPHYTTYATTGPSHFLGFYWEEEGSSKPAITDAIFNLAGKVKTSVTSQITSGLLSFAWGGSTEKAATKKTDPLEVRAMKLRARNFLLDSSRQGERIFLAPYGNLAAVTDDQNRVFLVQVHTRQILRVWKGYRQAECAWLEARGSIKGTKDQQYQGRVLYLVLFAPKRGILEIWTMTNGPRVAALNMDRKGRLLTPSVAQNLGGNFSDPLLSEKDPVYFLNSDGTLMKITADFHAALQDETTSHAHDEHIIRKLKSAIPSNIDNETTTAQKAFLNTLRNVLKEFKTVPSLRRAIDFILNLSGIESVSLLASLVDYTMESLQTPSTSTNEPNTQHTLSLGGRVFQTQLLAYQQLLNLYATLVLNRRNSVICTDENSPKEDVASILHLSEEELKAVVDRLSRCKRNLDTSQQSAHNFSVKEFLQCFDLTAVSSSVNERNNNPKNSPSDQSYLPMKLHGNASTALMNQLGGAVFEPVLLGKQSVDDFGRSIIPMLGLSKDSVFTFFCDYWLQAIHNFSVYPPILLELLTELSKNMNSTEWTAVLEIKLRQSNHIQEAYTLCLIARAVLLSKSSTGDNDQMETDEEQQNEQLAWETVGKTQGTWDLLLAHLASLLCLYSLQDDQDTCSLDELLSKGRGYYAEKLGQLIARHREEAENVSEWFSEAQEPPLNEIVFDLRIQLPLSFTQENVIAESAWELGSVWSKNLNETELLESSVSFLRLIRHPHLQFGLSYLLWTTFVGEKFKSLCLLIEKVGKYPKDRLLRKDVGISETGILSFADCCVAILDILMESNRVHEITQALPHRREDFMESLFVAQEQTNSGGVPRESLVERTAKIKPGNFFLITLHKHLAMVTKILLNNKGIKPARPYSYFDYKAKKAFFQSFNSYPLISIADTDNDIRSARQRLCSTAVTEAIAHSPEPENEDSQDKDVKEIHLLAEEWELDYEEIWRQEIVTYYRLGRYQLAERRLSLVHEKGKLGEDLLILFGSLLAHRIEERKTTAEIQSLLSAMSNTTRTWLQNLPAQEINLSMSEDPEKLRLLLKNAMSFLLEGSSSAVLANEFKGLLDIS